MPADPIKLRELASWYREFAERAGNPTIWASRMRTAEDFDLQADLLDRVRSLKGKRRSNAMAEREDEVRTRAYAIWEQEGRPEDRSLDHWLRAEAEIIAAAGARDDGKPALPPELLEAA